MKFLNAFFMAAAFVAITATTADQSLEEFVSASLLQLRQEMAAGIPQLEIPPMDPHALPDAEKRIANKMASLSFRLKDVTSTSLSTFDPRSVPIKNADGSADVAVMDSRRLHGQDQPHSTRRGLSL